MFFFLFEKRNNIRIFFLLKSIINKTITKLYELTYILLYRFYIGLLYGNEFVSHTPNSGCFVYVL